MHAAMMAIQNFGFFIMYYDIWGDTPAGDATGGVCDETRLWVGVMALDCWGVAHLCVGMAYAGYTEGHFWFPFYCASHRASVAARARASCLHAAASPAPSNRSRCGGHDLRGYRLTTAAVAAAVAAVAAACPAWCAAQGSSTSLSPSATLLSTVRARCSG
jgi:hypothetical protein